MDGDLVLWWPKKANIEAEKENVFSIWGAGN
jgi:hypothetical protein